MSFIFVSSLCCCGSEWFHTADSIVLWRKPLFSKAHITSLCISICLWTLWHIALWEFTCNQFIFICFCWAKSRHFSDVTAPAAFPKLALYITTHLCLQLSFSSAPQLPHSLLPFIFIACTYTQLSHTWFKCISVGIRAQKLLQVSVWLFQRVTARYIWQLLCGMDWVHVWAHGAWRGQSCLAWWDWGW